MKIKVAQKLKATDFNKELEKVLENKDFEVNSKNLLLSMLYKIENSYNDYKKVKVDVKSKEEIIKDIIKIIDEYCDKIEVVTPQTEKSKELDKTGKNIINIKEGYIKTYENEMSMLIALYEMAQNVEKYNDEKKGEKNSELLDFYNEAKVENECEIIRDFDGWSWNPNLNNNLKIMYNLLYQDIQIVYEKENIKNVILNGAENFQNIEILIKTYMALSNIEISEKIKNEIEEKKKNLLIVQDNEKFLNHVTEEKKKLTKEIGTIDEIVNNEEKLRQEYKEKNSKLKNEEKIFSISYLEDMLVKEREEKVEQLKEKNNLLNPTQYVKYKEKIEKEFEYYDMLEQNIEYSEVRRNTLVEVQKQVIKKITEAINNCTEKESIKEIIYKTRYYLLQKVSNKENIIQMPELEEEIKNLINTIIDIAIDKDVLTNISDSTSICYYGIKYIFESRNIDLEDVSIKIEQTEEKDKIIIEIFDGQEIEKSVKVNLQSKDLLNVKTKKKIKLFC